MAIQLVLKSSSDPSPSPSPWRRLRLRLRLRPRPPARRRRIHPGRRKPPFFRQPPLLNLRLRPPTSLNSSPPPAPGRRNPPPRPPTPSPSPAAPVTQSPTKSLIFPSEHFFSPSKTLVLSPFHQFFLFSPTCLGWFSFGEIHETERKILPEFFDGKLVSRNPRVYKYYRDSIIRRFRRNPSRKITFTEARRGLIGDVGSIRRVFDFLDEWGLINYAPSTKPSSKEKREAEEALEKKESPKKLCSNCKSVCSIACFATDKVGD